LRARARAAGRARAGPSATGARAWTRNRSPSCVPPTTDRRWRRSRLRVLRGARILRPSSCARFSCSAPIRFWWCLWPLPARCPLLPLAGGARALWAVRALFVSSCCGQRPPTWTRAPFHTPLFLYPPTARGGGRRIGGHRRVLGVRCPATAAAGWRLGGGFPRLLLRCPLWRWLQAGLAAGCHRRRPPPGFWRAPSSRLPLQGRV